MIAISEINRLENAIRQVNRELSEKKTFKDWKRFTEEELFNELCSCILGSRITFEKAEHVSRVLRQEGLLSLDYPLIMTKTSRQVYHDRPWNTSIDG